MSETLLNAYNIDRSKGRVILNGFVDTKHHNKVMTRQGSGAIQIIQLSD